MTKLNRALQITVTCVALLVALPGASFGGLVNEVGDLNIIDDDGNPSNGLRYLDLTYSKGRTLASALANAQATYSNAREATPSEWDDLFAICIVRLFAGARQIRRTTRKMQCLVFRLGPWGDRNELVQ